MVISKKTMFKQLKKGFWYCAFSMTVWIALYLYMVYEFGYFIPIKSFFQHPIGIFMMGIPIFILIKFACMLYDIATLSTGYIEGKNLTINRHERRLGRSTIISYQIKYINDEGCEEFKSFKGNWGQANISSKKFGNKIVKLYYTKYSRVMWFYETNNRRYLL